MKRVWDFLTFERLSCLRGISYLWRYTIKALKKSLIYHHNDFTWVQNSKTVLKIWPKPPYMANWPQPQGITDGEVFEIWDKGCKVKKSRSLLSNFWTYRVTINERYKVLLHCEPNLRSSDLLRLLGANQIWSIWKFMHFNW